MQQQKIEKIQTALSPLFMGNSAVSLAAKFRPQAGPGLSQILSMLG